MLQTSLKKANWLNIMSWMFKKKLCFCVLLLFIFVFGQVCVWGILYT